MQEVFKIESSHLTYHLENLGDLLFKTKDGKYALSSFGEAATSMMYHVEETPKTRPMLPSLTMKWKACLAVLIVGLILSAGLYYVQYQALSQISDEYDRTKAEAEQLQNLYNEAKAEGEQLQNEYNRTRAELEQLQNEYNKLKTDAEQLQSDYAELKGELMQLQNEYAKIEAEAERLQNLLEQYLGSRIIFVDGDNVGDPLENGSFTHPYDMIQEGVNAASLGDLVLVASGTYYEHVTVAKSLTLVGEDIGNTIIDGNYTVSGASEGVVNVAAENVEIRGFTIQHSGEQGRWAFSSGICLKSGNNKIIGNAISNNNYGIISGLVNNTISGNTITANDVCGIHSYSSSNNLILENTISGNPIGIWLEGWGNINNTICNNSITNNDVGVLITGWIQIGGGGATLSIYSEIPSLPPSNNTISGNIVSGNDYGIYIDASIGNTVVGNTISNNEFGIKVLVDPYIPSGNNTLYHNNFIDNKNQASAAGKNTWDNGYPSGGNYWSNYSGVDLYSGPYQNETGSDGIGDTPYIIDENNTDNYPLMGMFSDFSVTLKEEIYHITTVCNSTISAFQFDQENKMVSFNVTGPDGTVGFCRITVPNVLVQDLWNGNYTVLVDGKEPTTLKNWTDAINTYLYFTYIHTSHENIIVPEFPSALILPLLLIVTLVAFIMGKMVQTKKIKE